MQYFAVFSMHALQLYWQVCTPVDLEAMGDYRIDNIVYARAADFPHIGR